MVVIERPGPGDVGDVVDLWLELAEGQRGFGSHLYAEENRDVIRSQISRSLVVGELLVARREDADDEAAEGSATSEEIHADGEIDAGVEKGGTGGRSDVVGFVMYGPETGSYQQDASRGTIHNIYVRETHRGRGVGTELLEAAEAALVDAGVDVVSIGVMVGNVDAQRLYRRRGYRPHRVELEKDVETETPNRSSEKG